MKRLDYLPTARRDLAGIFDYLETQADADVATLALERIYEAALRLEQYPESTPARPDISEDFRSLVVGRYLVLYRVRDDSVDVVRVVHGARDLGRLRESR